MPSRLVKNETTATETFAQFVAEPFDRGYGHTIGNSLRRVLLSSLEGAAITSVRIKGAEHEFSTLPGVLEDVTQIVLNLKKVKFSTIFCPAISQFRCSVAFSKMQRRNRVPV